MKLVVLITLFAIFHNSVATIDIVEITETVKENLQGLHATAKENIQSFHATAKENIQAFHATAKSELDKIVAGINLENAKKVDIFHVIPKVTKLKNLLTGDKKKEMLILDPYQAERLSQYFDDYHHHHHHHHQTHHPYHKYA